MLQKIGVLTSDERELIQKSLQEIAISINEGSFEWSEDLEDVHMNIEAALTAKIGDVGKKLHTGRSRNDQISTDVRLWLMDQIDDISSIILAVQKNIVELAVAEHDTIMPGFTHLQVAQPITFGHHMLAWNQMFKRDYERLLDCRKRVDCNPLGSAALAGTGFEIDRLHTSNLLGFSKVSENSLDAVSDRDFVIDFCAFASTCMMHLSRMSEELIIWASSQFNFINSSDIRDRCIMQVLANAQKSITKSLSLTASREFSLTLEKPSRLLVCRRSISNPVPAKAADPRGLQSTRFRQSNKRS
jgi:argininosuccinate lyase